MVSARSAAWYFSFSFSISNISCRKHGGYHSPFIYYWGYKVWPNQERHFGPPEWHPGMTLPNEWMPLLNECCPLTGNLKKDQNVLWVKKWKCLSSSCADQNGLPFATDRVYGHDPPLRVDAPPKRVFPLIHSHKYKWNGNFTQINNKTKLGQKHLLSRVILTRWLRATTRCIRILVEKSSYFKVNSEGRNALPGGVIPNRTFPVSRLLFLLILFQLQMYLV